MKLRVLCLALGVVGSVAVFALTLASLVPLRKTADAASAQTYQPAQRALDAAKADHAAARAQLDGARQDLTDAQCFLDGHAAFIKNVHAWCDADQLGTYGLQLAYRDNVLTRSTTRDSRRETYRCTKKRNCKTSSSGVETCETYEGWCDKWVYFDVYRTQTDVYGLFLSGAGSDMMLQCGRYSAGVNAHAAESADAPGTWIRTSETTEQRTVRHYSRATIALRVNSADEVADVSVQDDAEATTQAILSKIKARCDELNTRMPTFAAVQTERNRVLDARAALEAAVTSAKTAEDVAQAERDRAYAVYRTEEVQYTDALKLWLPLLLVAVPAFWLVFYNTTYDVELCPPPTAKEVPVLAEALPADHVPDAAPVVSKDDDDVELGGKHMTVL